MANPGLQKNYVAQTAVKKHRIVAFGAQDGVVVHATAATAKSIGVVAELDADAGERVDVVRSDIAEVEYGGTVARGDLLMADAQGRAIVAVPGANVRVIGVAEVSGVAGDIGSAMLGCGSLHA